MTFIPLVLDEISKHMQDLSAEFEELFDPYLPVTSTLKIKTCPGFGVNLDFTHRREAINLRFLL
jgi:hypothetical protein